MFAINTILIAEPNRGVRTEMEFLLVESGFQVTLAEAPDVLRLVEERPFDLVILAARQPGTSGAELCQAIRERCETPVILVTAAGEEQDLLTCLDAGATDFILQPMRPKELLARVRAALRRARTPSALPGWVLQHGELMLDLRSRKLVKNGRVIPLTRTELRLLHFFMRHPDQALSKDALLRNVWNYRVNTGDYNLVDTAIKRLRQTIEDAPKHPRYIQTVWGAGFRLGD